MKTIKLCIYLLVLSFAWACFEVQVDEAEDEEEIIRSLPFTTLPADLGSFQPVSENWQIAGDVQVNRSAKRVIIPSDGKGVLVNIPEEGKKQNLFTRFEHGDIEIELDVMMPVESNSGIYFQGRYEIQLLDSWGVKDPKHSDIGGIYQRWDDTKSPQERGFEGRPPRINAAKAPGLWQHLTIVFQAPRFDDLGNKVQNARFNEVWLNGALLHHNQEVTGPTRASAFNDEKHKGPLMIQGDHGPVAFRNIKYKLYNGKPVAIRNLTLKEYVNENKSIPDVDTLVLSRDISTDTLSSQMASGQNPQKLLVFSGMLDIPISGEYVFEMVVKLGGALLLIDQDTIINLDGDYNLDHPGFGLSTLSQGEVPFTFIYNKHRPFQRGFGLFIEGPGIAKHALHSPGSLEDSKRNRLEPIIVNPSEDPIIQRTFIMHNGKKRTHCASVGTLQNIHFSYDLATGSLLQIWGGGFLDVTKMWHSRGTQQVGEPLGVSVSTHGDPDFTFLKNLKSNWPDTISAKIDYQQLGYVLHQDGLPVFLQQLEGATISNKLIPNDTARILKRLISSKSNKDLWHKIAEGDIIQEMSDGTFAIDDKNYFVDLGKAYVVNPILRKKQGKEELLLKIPAGEQEISYSIIW